VVERLGIVRGSKNICEEVVSSGEASREKKKMKSRSESLKSEKKGGGGVGGKRG